MSISNLDIVQVKYKTTLKGLKDQAHLYFDKIWKLKYLERDEAYQHMAAWLGVDEPRAHMSNADEDTCKRIIYRSIQILNDMRRLDLDFGAQIRHPYYEIIEPKEKKAPNPLHTPFKEAYVNFCRNTLKMPEKFGAAEAKLTLSVISWVRKAVEIKNQGPATDEEVLGAWQLILDKYDLWGFDKGKSLTLGQIYCRLQNITESIRQNAGGKTTNGKQVGLTPEEEAELNAYNNG